MVPVSNLTLEHSLVCDFCPKVSIDVSFHVKLCELYVGFLPFCLGTFCFFF